MTKKNYLETLKSVLGRSMLDYYSSILKKSVGYKSAHKRFSQISLKMWKVQSHF